MKKIFYLTVILFALATSACTTQIHSDYPQYLLNNQAGVALPQVANSVKYYLDPATENHSETINSFMAGAANTWIVRFGKILDATMNSSQIKAAFHSVKKTNSREGAGGLLLIFSLQKYQFSDFNATISLKISAYMDGREILSKDYNKAGISQGGKVFWGGGFAMKNAVQQSTKFAVDRIFMEFIPDLKNALAGRA